MRQFSFQYFLYIYKKILSETISNVLKIYFYIIQGNLWKRRDLKILLVYKNSCLLTYQCQVKIIICFILLDYALPKRMQPYSLSKLALHLLDV